MQLNTVSPDEIRRILYLSKNEERQYIKTYTVFETVRAEVRRLLNDPSVLESTNSKVYQAGINAWIFDRLFNGAWKYTNPESIDGLTPFDQDIVSSGTFYHTEVPKKKIVVKPKSSFWDTFKEAKRILTLDVDGGLVSNILGDSGIQRRVEKDSTFIDSQFCPTSGWNPKIKPIDTWGPSIAVYGKSKNLLLVNPMYCRNMDTNPEELEFMVKTGRFQELIDSKYAPKLAELLTLLMEGKSYKNQVLKSSRTGKSIAWNSVGNQESGSIRIGKDVTDGEAYQLNHIPGNGFSLHAEELFTKMRQEVLDRIRAIDTTGFDSDEIEEFNAKCVSIATKLRVLSTCGSALDQCWENGPYLMNIIKGDEIYGNKNYGSLIGMQGLVKLSDIYNQEQLDKMNHKFTQGRMTGHYENNFTMQLKDGSTPTFPWHRFFARPDKPNLGSNISFGIGTTTMHSRIGI